MGESNKTGVNTSRVYQETTLPINTKKTSRRRDKSDLGEHFVAPDGGWAWLVCIAAGVSNLSIYPCLQQFGFLFRERMEFLGMSSSQITTIINTNPAISSCSGLLNGPMFRRFTFRQVALAGAFFIFTGIMLTAFCESFVSYMISYGILFGFGMGISVSASSLAINTYFKNKRRIASGFSWTITGLGPIFLPYFVTFLLTVYGVQGTVWIFGALSLHTVICALIYQPVRHHAPPEIVPLQNDTTETIYICKYCELHQNKQTSLFSSQYLYQDDDEDMPGYEITEPGTPMMSRANDGWFGSKLSLASDKTRFRKGSSARDLEGMAKLKKIKSEEELKPDEFFKPNYFKRKHDEALKHSNSIESQRLRIGRNSTVGQLSCTCNEGRNLLVPQLQPKTITNTDTTLATVYNNNTNNMNSDDDSVSSTKSIQFMEKVVAFFDLSLLRDFTFVNLVVGLTIINFGELNFSILTPFILNDFGFDTSQITLAMSVLAGCDIIVRFLVPFITEKIPWDNRVFFLIGVVGIALGRTVVACTRSFTIILSSFVWIGMCKGVRTIFWPLILPSYVPLKRLPAASGLQLLITGLFSLAAGPFVGLIRDRYNYSVTLHFLNMMSFVAAISWTLEALIRQHYRKRKKFHSAQI